MNIDEFIALYCNDLPETHKEILRKLLNVKYNEYYFISMERMAGKVRLLECLEKYNKIKDLQKKNTEYYCPACGSHDINYDEARFDPHVPVCNRCGNYIILIKGMGRLFKRIRLWRLKHKNNSKCLDNTTKHRMLRKGK